MTPDPSREQCPSSSEPSPPWSRAKPLPPSVASTRQVCATAESVGRVSMHRTGEMNVGGGRWWIELTLCCPRLCGQHVRLRLQLSVVG